VAKKIMNNENEQKYAVVHIGGLDDCKFVLETLKSVDIDALLDVADKFGKKYANKGYYVVAVAEEQAEKAQIAIETQLRKNLNIDEMADSSDNLDKCLACGTQISENDTECPDCGISFA